MTIGETVSLVENNSKWKTNLLVGIINVKFKIDTEAGVTVIPENIFRRCKLGLLQCTSKKLFGADQKGLRVIGEIREAWRNLRDRRHLCRQRSLKPVLGAQPLKN